MLLNNLADHYAEKNQPKLAATYFRKAAEAEERAKLVRHAAASNELLSTNLIKDEAARSNGEE